MRERTAAMTGVKICGVNSAHAFDAAAEAGADWIGFVFFPPSPRHVTPREAAALSERLNGGPRRVGLFVDPTDEALAATLDALALDVLQLYASSDRVHAVAARFSLPVWRSVAVEMAADLPKSLHGESALVIESRAPRGATRPGGNARSLDPGLLAGWTPGFDWLLAGGLRPDNVAAAIRATHAPAVDVSSGVETAPGQKDPVMIQAFIAAVRGLGAVEN